MKKFLLSIGCFLFLLGCSDVGFKLERYQKYSASTLLAKGNEEFMGGEYLEAIGYYEALDAFYPFEPETKIGQLNVIEAYLYEHEYDLMIASAGRYLKLYPEDIKLDLVYYYRGIAHLEKGRTLGQRIFHTELSKIDLDGFRLAFQNFSFLLNNYPKSEKAYDARMKMLFIRNLLAEHELRVAHFYFAREAYLATIERIKVLLSQYDGALQIKEGLRLMEAAYKKLDLKKQAEIIKELRQMNFGETKDEEAYNDEDDEEFLLEDD